MPRIDRTMAVHYNKTQMIWLDNEASKGGKRGSTPIRRRLRTICSKSSRK